MQFQNFTAVIYKCKKNNTNDFNIQNFTE